MSTGFAEAGPEGERRQRELVELARGNGMRIIGPASMGVINTDPAAPLHASFAPLGVPAGNIGVSLQSGPLGTAMIELARRLGAGLSTFVSLGNKGDVSANDLLNYWYDDPATEVVLPLHRELRQPAQVRAHRPARVAAQADRGREVRPGLARTTSPPTPCTCRPA